MSTIGPRPAGDGLPAGKDILDGLGSGVRREFVAPPPDAAMATRLGKPDPRPLANDLPFELGDAAEHLHQHAAGGR